MYSYVLMFCIIHYGFHEYHGMDTLKVHITLQLHEYQNIFILLLQTKLAEKQHSFLKSTFYFTIYVCNN